MDSKDREIKELKERLDKQESDFITLASRLNQFYRIAAYNSLYACRNDENVPEDVKDKLEKVVRGKALVDNWSIVDGKPLEPILRES